MFKQKRGAGSVLLVLILIGLVLSLILYLLSRTKAVRNISLALLLFFIFLAIVYFLEHFFSRSRKLRRTIKKLDSSLLKGSLEELKKGYLEVYDLYLKISDKEKSKFYLQTTRIREKIEEYLKATKKVETMLTQAGRGSLEEQKKYYQELHALFLKLPQKEQNRFYQAVVCLQEQLEEGR